MKKKAQHLINQKLEHLNKEVKKKLVKLYFKSPAKVQFALAKYGIKAIMNKKKEDLEEIIRH
jgi:uncharacterized protein YajQ (UPF0234 family)